MLAYLRLGLIVGLLGLGVGGNSTAWTAAHPYHVSSAEIRWNETTGNFEVALCVWPADLERAIANQTKSAANLERVVDLDAELHQYVAARFSIQAKLSDANTTTDAGTAQSDAESGAEKPTGEFRWVGHEIDLKQAWLYFEIPGSQRVGQWQIDNRVFFELNEEQLNQVQLSVGNSSSSVALTHANPTHDFETAKKSRALGLK